LWRVLRRERPDIVHTHSSKAGILGRWAARWAGVPFIVHTFHGFGFHPGQWPLVFRHFVWLERTAAQFTDVLVAVSKANWEEGLSRRIGRASQYRLIRSGVSLPVFYSIRPVLASPPELNLRTEHKLVTTIGPMKPQKNLEDFLEAAAVVAARFPEALFLIIGDGPGRPGLERLARRLGIADKVLMPGWRRDIADIFARTQVFCMTSLWEGLPRSLVEAMAAGLPCVANAVDGCKDVIENGLNGYLVPPRHPLATAERVLRLLEWRDLAAAMAHRARVSVGEEFDIDRMVSRQDELYRSLAARVDRNDGND
jgi:glycosyltransferase involved in cell wall biosynthesis